MSVRILDELLTPWATPDPCVLRFGLFMTVFGTFGGFMGAFGPFGAQFSNLCSILGKAHHNKSICGKNGDPLLFLT